MAIWNDTIIHGVLNVTDGYYFTKCNKKLAEFNLADNTIELGDNISDIKLLGNTIASTMSGDVINSNIINSKLYKISGTDINSGEIVSYNFASFSSTDVNDGKTITIGGNTELDTIHIQSGSSGKITLSSYQGVHVNGSIAATNGIYGILSNGSERIIGTVEDYGVILGDNYTTDIKTYLNGNNIDINAYNIVNREKGNITTTGTLLIDNTCKIYTSDTDDAINVVSMITNNNEHTLSFSANKKGDYKINTVINGHRVIFGSHCYGTGDPPTNGTEGQIYFKII